ncbi:MAG TPA: hypothetical protein VG365_12250 [Solirubrobacteraceae bacterium]|jgi:hypothetical protein|nr:hypothetical protein [Solirubrobacteraceae bacterium]
MALGFIPSDAAMLVVQAAVVAAPRRPPEVRWIRRLSGPAWALIPIGSIVGVIFAIRYVSATATGLTWLALIAVPLLAAAALGWAMRGSRPWLALLAVPLFVLAWASRTTLWGEGAATLLAALSCVTLGVLLAAVTPPRWMKLGIIAMSVADVWLVVSDLLQAPNSTLIAAAPLPGSGLPQLQSELFGSVSLGYGDLFVAGLLGAVLACECRRQGPMALLTLVLAGAFDLLFFFVHELPATVPVAVALILSESWRWHRRRARRRLQAPASSPRTRVETAAGG